MLETICGSDYRVTEIKIAGACYCDLTEEECEAT